MSKSFTRQTFITLGLLSSSSIQVDLSASEFAWSEDRCGIQSQVAAIRSEAMAMQEHFPDKSRDILRQLDELQSASSPEAALTALQETISRTIKEYESSPKRLSKYIPAETRQIESVEHKKVPFHRGYHEDLVNDVERLAHQLRHQKNIRNVDTYCESIVPGAVCVFPVFGWIAKSAATYDGWVKYDEVSYHHQKVRAARTETKDLSNLLRMFEAIQRTVQRDQKRLEEEARRRRTAELERQRREAAAAKLKKEREDERRGLSAQALFELGGLYNQGKNGRAMDVAHAVSLYREAADKGHKLACTYVAIHGYFGSGIPKNDQLAAHYCRLAYDGPRKETDAFNRFYNEATAALQEADRKEQELKTYWDNPSKLFELGNSYTKGSRNNYAHAVKLFKRAAERGHKEAAFNAYNHSFHSTSDRVTARECARLVYRYHSKDLSWGGAFCEFFHQATADLRAEDARKEALERQRKAEEKAEADRRQAEIDRCGRNGQALYDLAFKYEAGTAGPARRLKDEVHAAKLLELAKAQQHGEACRKLGEKGYIPTIAMGVDR